MSHEQLQSEETVSPATHRLGKLPVAIGLIAATVAAGCQRHKLHPPKEGKHEAVISAPVSAAQPETAPAPQTEAPAPATQAPVAPKKEPAEADLADIRFVGTVVQVKTPPPEQREAVDATVVELTDATYRNFIRRGLVLVDLYAEWCGPCKYMAPKVDELAKRYAGTLRAGKVDTDTQHAASSALIKKGQGIPQFAIFKDGKEVARIIGADPEGLEAAIAHFSNN
ncbi:hypothetical protein KBD59_04025 [Candidatus Gracilibacteria bacterium]|nr:hypothetical protein [Candidatus Gracilibacteria bacterium]